MKTTLIFAAILLAFTGCESTVDNPEWPEYNEKLVVVGSVRFSHDDSVLVECTVRRTIPLWELFTPDKAILPTAQVRLDDGEQVHDVPLVSSSSARFSKKLLRSGSNRYTLLVSEGTKHARATLDVETHPAAFSYVKIDTLEYGFGFRGAIQINPAQNAAFVVRYQIRDSAQTEWMTQISQPYIPGREWYSSEWYRISSDILIFHTFIYNEPTETPILTRFVVEAYSREYTEYQLAESSHYDGDEFFGSPQKNPPFTVTGDGIGFVWYVLEGPPLELKFSR